MTPSELYAVDSLGIPRFTEQQAKAVVDMVRKQGALVSDPPACEGTGIVIAGGGRYLSWAWVNCQRLRRMGCGLPIQVWHLGIQEMPPWAVDMFRKLDCETVDTYQVMSRHPVREMGGWQLKTYAVRHCPWEHVMFLDADCIPQILPEEVLNDTEVRKHGSLFCHDVGKHHPGPWTYLDFGILPLEKEWETGQFVWHKTKAWMALRWVLWASEHTDTFYQGVHGDKGLIEVCVRSSGCPFIMAEKSEWSGWGISHHYAGRLTWTHLMGAKRGETAMPFGLQAGFDEWKANTMGKI